MVSLGGRLAGSGRAEEAERWLRRAADTGDPWFMYPLADFPADTDPAGEADYWYGRVAAGAVPSSGPAGGVNVERLPA